MARSYRIISGDSHLEIDSKAWVGRVPAQHRDRVPHTVRLPDGGDAWLVEGRPLRPVPFDLYGGKGRDNWKPFGQSYESTPGTGSPQQRIREQDQDGIDAEVLFPGISGPPMWRAIVDDDAYLATVRAYNDFLADEYCSVDRDRLIGLGAIPWTGVNDAIAEMEHCARAGLKGVALGTFPNGKGHPTPEDDKFWAAALDLQMPITVHEELDRSAQRAGSYILYPQAPKEMLAQITGIREFAGQVAKFGRLGAVNAVQLTMDGVFDRFPDLQIFFAETQIGWIPFFFEMADARYERHLPWAEELVNYAPLQQLPSDYIKQHCSWGFQHDRFGVLSRHHIGVDHLIWATDFPHQDSEFPHSMKLVDHNFEGVPEDEKHKMICTNAVEFFHLDQLEPA